MRSTLSILLLKSCKNSLGNSFIIRMKKLNQNFVSLISITLLNFITVCRNSSTEKKLYWVFPAEYDFSRNICEVLKDTHKKKAPSNKTPRLLKSMTMDIYIKLNLNTRFLNLNKNFFKKISYWQNSVLCDRSILYSLHYLS